MGQPSPFSLPDFVSSGSRRKPDSRGVRHVKQHMATALREYNSGSRQAFWPEPPRLHPAETVCLQGTPPRHRQRDGASELASFPSQQPDTGAANSPRAPHTSFRACSRQAPRQRPVRRTTAISRIGHTCSTSLHAAKRLDRQAPPQNSASPTPGLIMALGEGLNGLRFR